MRKERLSRARLLHDFAPDSEENRHAISPDAAIPLRILPPLP